MRTYIVGPSGVGKTPLAKQIVLYEKREHISAGAWSRAAILQGNDSAEQYREKLIAYSRQVLAKDPDHTIAYLTPRLTPNAIIDGIRNPRDFAHLFDYRRDEVIFIDAQYARPTQFDTGIDSIKSYATWLVTNKLLPEKNMRSYLVDVLERQCCERGVTSLDDVIARETYLK